MIRRRTYCIQEPTVREQVAAEFHGGAICLGSERIVAVGNRSAAQNLGALYGPRLALSHIQVFWDTGGQKWPFGTAAPQQEAVVEWPRSAGVSPAQHCRTPTRVRDDTRPLADSASVPTRRAAAAHLSGVQKTEAWVKVRPAGIRSLEPEGATGTLQKARKMRALPGNHRAGVVCACFTYVRGEERLPPANDPLIHYVPHANSAAADSEAVFRQATGRFPAPHRHANSIGEKCGLSRCEYSFEQCHPCASTRVD
jgi:hypothetical protein